MSTAEARLSVLVQVNPGQATPGLTAVETGLKGVAGAAANVNSETQKAAQPITLMAQSAGQASTELQRLIDVSTGVTTATGLTARETIEYGQALDALRARFNPIFATTQRYTQELIDIAAAEELGAISAMEAATARERAAAIINPMSQDLVRLGQSAAGAQFNVTNLGYQMNDVFMMAALGQAPMMLALQQGPQVIQVFNQMKASGQAIGPALVGSLTSFLNPMGVATIAAIAGGAALAQWAMSAIGAGEEALTAGEAVESFEASLDRYSQYAAIAGATTAELSERFGDFGEQARAFAEYMQAVELGEALSGMRAGIDPLKGELIGIVDTLQLVAASQERLANLERSDAPADVIRQEREALELLTGVAEEAASGLSLTTEQAALLAGAIDGLGSASGLTNIRDHAAEALELIQQWYPAGMELPAALGETTELLERIVTRAGEATAEADGAAEATRRQAELQEIINTNIYARQSLLQDERGSQAAIRAELEAIRALQASDAATAQQRLNDLQAQAQMNALIALYGADSVQVEEAKAAAARGTYAEWVAGLSVSSDLKEELLAAYDAEVLMANAAMSGPIEAAAGSAQALAAELGVALSIAQALQNVGITSAATADDERGSQRAAVDGAREYNTQQGINRANERLRAQLAARNPRNQTGGSGGGGSNTSDRDVVERMFDGLERELAQLREMDPVQRELLRHRDALALATATERAEVEQLIRTRIEEAEALELVQERMVETRELGRDVIGSIVQGLRDGADAGDILGSVLDKIADKLLDLGTNGLTDILFGTGQQGGGGGFLGGFVQNLLFGGIGIGGGGGSGFTGPRPQARPFALGDVFTSPEFFGFGGGQLGVMAEAGPEAVMPLTHAVGQGVGARIGDHEFTLPLTRLGSGKLGVGLAQMASPFALGDAFGDLPAAPASWRQAQVAAGSSARGQGGNDLSGEIVVRLILPEGMSAETVQAMRGIAVQVSRETTRQAMREYDSGLPARMSQLNQDPDWMGS